MKTINRVYSGVILIFAIPILTVLVFLVSSDTRPVHNWRIQNMDDGYFRIRYKNLALSVDENSGEIGLSRAERNKDNQLWRAIKTE